MGREEPSILDELDEVWKAAQDAHRARQRAVRAMSIARMAGATDEQIAEASGLSVRAVRAYIQRRLETVRDSSSESTYVGRRPPRRRRRTDPPRPW